MIIGMTKAFLILFWAAWALALLSVLPDSWNLPVMWIGVALLVIHLGEYLFLHAKLAALQAGNSGFFGTVVFGFAYWLPLLRK